MEQYTENNTLTFCPEGRIDSANAADIEKEIMEAAEQASGAEITLDAAELEYISSAGLRVFREKKPC